MTEPTTISDKRAPLVDFLCEAKRGVTSLSIFRMLCGVAVLTYILPSLKDRHYLWGAGSKWNDPEVEVRQWPTFFDALFPKENVVIFDLTYALLIVVAMSFTIGLFTRAMTPLLFVLWTGLASNSTVLSNGGDNLLRIVLLFAIFADLSQRFSVDSQLRRTRALSLKRSAPNRLWVKVAHNTVLILCIYQICLVYVTSGIYKLMGAEWRDGTALYYGLSLDVFHVLPLGSELLWQSSLVIVVSTWISVGVQALFPLLILFRPTRLFAVSAMLLMHLMIATLFGLWTFSLPMMALDLLIVSDQEWNHLRRRVAQIIQPLRSVILAPKGPRVKGTP